MLEKIIFRIENEKSISPPLVVEALEKIMGGGCQTQEIEHFLRLVNDCPLSAAILAAAASVMRGYSLKLSKRYPEALDTCGTGGDFSNSINVSTLSALVLAAGGVTLAKHGNRSNSGVCGSADLLELLGVRIDLGPAQVQRCLEETGFGFFFAPKFHPAMKYAAEARKQIQGKTLFNLLGPLSNPSGACYQIAGVFEEKLIRPYLSAMKSLGMSRALVFHGLDGMDEITVYDKTIVGELRQGSITEFVWDPKSLGIDRVSGDRLRVGSKAEAGQRALAILSGKVQDETLQIVALNAGAGFYVMERCRSISEGYEHALVLLKQAKASDKLKQIIELTERLYEDIGPDRRP